MTIPPIPKDNNGIPGTTAWLKGLAPPTVDPAVDRLGVTLETLRLGHNSTLQRLAVLEAQSERLWDLAVEDAKRIAVLEAKCAALPWPLGDGA